MYAYAPAGDDDGGDFRQDPTRLMLQAMTFQSATGASSDAALAASARLYRERTGRFSTKDRTASSDVVARATSRMATKRWQSRRDYGASLGGGRRSKLALHTLRDRVPRHSELSAWPAWHQRRWPCERGAGDMPRPRHVA